MHKMHILKLNSLVISDTVIVIRKEFFYNVYIILYFITGYCGTSILSFGV